MNRIVILLFVVSAFALSGCESARNSANIPLTVGKYISQPSGSGQNVGSMPINMLTTPDGKFAIVSDIGNFQSLWAIRTSDGVGTSHIDYPNRLARARAAATQPEGDEVSSNIAPGSPRSVGLYYGLAISPDNTIYAAQGNHQTVAVLHLDDRGILSRDGEIPTPGVFAAGLALDDYGHLFVADNASRLGDPFKTPGGVFIYDISRKSEIGHFRFTQSHGGTSNFPLGIAASSDGNRAYVASERDDSVYVLETHDPGNIKLLATLATGAHPVAVLLSTGQSRIYVANSLSDTVSIIDTASNRIIATILLRPSMARDIPGVSPIGLTLSTDEKSLYVALSDMNAVGVIDTERQQLLGYVPTQWYPSAIALTPDGKRLLVANGKGRNVRTPNNVHNPHDTTRPSTYILDALEGNVAMTSLPATDAEMDQSTQLVLKQNRLNDLVNPQPNPLRDIGLAAGKIKHVVYIIKENRTYDQILGDISKGNGDKSLVLFGKSITPNLHALAERFVLLDNLYASGEVSGDGWAWSTEGMADAFIQRNVPYQYSHRGRPFDFEGTSNGLAVGGVPEKVEAGKPLATNPSISNGTEPIPDVGSTGNFIWSAARRAGLSLRNYGFFLYNATDQLAGGPDNFPDETDLQPAGHDLAGISDLDYRRFDLDYADSDASATLAAQAGNSHYLYGTPVYGKYNMPSRYSEWNREFQMMLAKDPDGSSVPTLMLVRMGDDHTVAAKSGAHTPSSMVADNDYGVGEIVQSISHSAIWNSTAIFIIEDDAQSGIDHVDAHRTTGYVVSPWIIRNSVDHTFYNSDSMLKTMELLLGLPALTQFDAVASPILDWYTAPTNVEPYQAIVPSPALILQKNPKAASLAANDPRLKLAQDSDAMDFTRADANSADAVDEITWKTVKGADSSIPSHSKSKVDKGDGDDDDD